MTLKAEDPSHPILREAHKHEIVGYHYDGLAEEPYLDLVLRHTETKAIRRLRFYSPRDVSISEPYMNSGMAIADVHHRQMERTRVRVFNFEASSGMAQFYARDVIDATDL
jgi:hypothetical protein